jgi:phage shock protein A
MSFIRRVAATLSANIDQAISRIENHDAVIEAAAHDTRQAAAELKVRLSRISSEVVRQREEINKLGRDELRWADRAGRVAAEDQPRALDCLRRRDGCRDRIDAMESRLERSQNLEHRLSAQLAQIDQRLADMDARRQELKGRELSSRGNAALVELDTDAAIDIDRAFDRWEVEVNRSEMVTGCWPQTHDHLKDVFERDERDAKLRAELLEMVNAGRKEQ